MLSRLKGLKLGTKVAVGFVVMIIFVMIVGYVGYWGLSSIERRAEMLAEAASISESAHEIGNVLLVMGKGAEKKVNSIMQRIFTQINQIEPKLEDEECRNHLQEVKERAVRFKEAFANYILSKENEDRMLQSLEDFQNACHEFHADQSSDMLSTQSTATSMMGIVTAMSVIMGVVFTIIIARGIKRPLYELRNIIFAAARGDLTQRFPYKHVNCSQILQCGNSACPEFGKDGVLCFYKTGSFAPELGNEIHCPKILKGIYKSCDECEIKRMVAPDEVKEIGTAVNTMIDSLQEMMLTIAAASEQIDTASSEVATSSQKLAEGASEQAASLEESSASMEEIASMAQQNADNAVQTDQLMKETQHITKETETSMKELTKSMEDMAKLAEETQKIVKSIDEIAFQTNLLALNAAVEAARAGEAGQGFAVVADEVRNLAQRTATAAKDTAELIEQTVRGIHNNLDLVKKVDNGFDKVGEHANKVASLVAEIAAASQEQTQGIGQVNTALSQMDKVTQQIAANAEELASASEEAKSQVANLISIISRFNLGDTKREYEIRKPAKAAVKIPPALSKKPSVLPPQTQVSKVKQKSSEPKPEEVIPLDEDFEEF